MSDLIQNFNEGLGSYLTKDQVKEICPVAFETAPTNPNVTNKYLFVNTETIIDDLGKLGWKPVTAAMRKNRGKDTIFSKHMVTFQNPDIMIKSKDGDDAFPRIILSNSHDGLQAFKFSVGIYRLVCSNGLVVADEEFSDFKIKHKGYTFEELRNVISQAVQDLPNKVEVLNKMKNRILTEVEKEKLALDAMLIRAGITPDSDKAKDFEYDKETIVDILEPKRDADKGSSLWTVFNVIQEKITKGDFHAALKGAKIRKVRAIKSFEKDLEVNKQLFRLATAQL
tara:strand:+ start:1268 stop:2113 length:846 start_codon:yes stop_codon:yes gene_type:complete